MSTYATNAEPPRGQPLYGATMVQAVKRFFTKYADFTGRASRSEFWWVSLAFFALSMVFLLIMVITVGMFAAATDFAALDDPAAGDAVGFGALGVATAFYGVMALAGLAVLVPTIAVTVRRLHDAGFSGWWYLLNLAPGGSIAVLVFTVLPSVPEGARFDDPPYGYPPAPNAPFLLSPYPYGGYPGSQPHLPPDPTRPPENPTAGNWPAPPSSPPAGDGPNPPRET
ncbi:DUF805 domain-containing protein [Zhihengliuella salsuginis]|uniref:DUF805 domain-containing protein n=1 Tax=Zhihengliuella salsuginis TaxID=578222 RepID=A0ABQ3GGE7_9MICC|nr:DUF805 domain-containing protein [Zhihengliuella salsuginis]GHD05203.1 hypothetical protein GCM10008096_13800 [Zhihengliuella salsuginis]